MWKHTLAAYGSEYIQIEMKEMKALFALQHGCRQFESDMEGDDLSERQEFKQHKHSSILGGRPTPPPSPRPPVPPSAPGAAWLLFSKESLSVSALQLDHRPVPNCHGVQQAAL